LQSIRLKCTLTAATAQNKTGKRFEKVKHARGPVSHTRHQSPRACRRTTTTAAAAGGGGGCVVVVVVVGVVVVVVLLLTLLCCLLVRLLVHVTLALPPTTPDIPTQSFKRYPASHRGKLLNALLSLLFAHRQRQRSGKTPAII
jgi:hypothetical protein